MVKFFSEIEHCTETEHFCSLTFPITITLKLLNLGDFLFDLNEHFYLGFLSLYITINFFKSAFSSL